MRQLLKTFVGIILLAFLTVYIGYSLTNLLSPKIDRAQRIAKWKSVYECLVYDFELVNMHENGIFPAETDSLSESEFKRRIIPYFNVSENHNVNLKKYKYKKMNGKPLGKSYMFLFNDFFVTKSGMILSVKRNDNYDGNDETPLFYMFVDINGQAKPNTIGNDIFILNIYRNKIRALGYGADRITMKTNCSPVGSGVYCSQYYLLGGKF